MYGLFYFKYAWATNINYDNYIHLLTVSYIFAG